MATINDYYTFSVADLKRLGYLQEYTAVSGRLVWSRDGEVIASVGAATDTRGVPALKLSYTYYGEPRDMTIYLRWKNSNLNPESGHGYYYFVCPRTGNLCRKLYLVDGWFMSRAAFKPLYPQQRQSHEKRNGSLAYFDSVFRVEELQKQPYRRETYSGKITPYGRRVRKAIEKRDRLESLSVQRLNEWCAKHPL